MPDWSTLFAHRKAVAYQFGSIWQVPLARRYHTVIEALGQQSTSVLEIGAGEKKLATRLRKAWGGVDYKSCDIDRSHTHNFYDISEVVGEYDLVCGLEVIEHLDLTAALVMVETCFARTKPGGRLVLTTPNIFYPPAFLRDATHVTPFCHDELGALMRLAGYEVSAIYRLHHDALLKKFLKRVIMYPMYRALGIDFAHQILVVGQKPA